MGAQLHRRLVVPTPVESPLPASTALGGLTMPDTGITGAGISALGPFFFTSLSWVSINPGPYGRRQDIQLCIGKMG